MIAGTVYNSTLKRRKPLRAKKEWKRKPAELKRSPLKRQSEKQQRQTRLYFQVKGEWMARQENRHCAVCLCRSLGRTWGELRAVLIREGAGKLADQGAKLKRAREVHHCRGRIGRLLCDTRFFVPTCHDCREWPHVHPAEAREFGLLASAAEWNVFPT